MTEYQMIPPAVMRSMKGHVELGSPTGSFVQAVLENNLKEAIGRADEHSYAALRQIVSWMYNEAPSTCWGSCEKVIAWRQARREKGIREMDLVAGKEQKE